MDVNRAQGISPIHNNSGGNAGQEHPAEEHAEHEGEAPRDGDAFEVAGLAAEITPAAQQVLDSLAAEIEPLRRQLAMAREREQNLREDLARHAFLPVPGRREFIRELNHVLNHLDDLAALPSLALFNVANAEEVRRSYGRDVLDRYLVHVANGISRTLQPTDVLGSLGGNDFGVIALGAGGDLAHQQADGIVKTLAAMPFGISAQSVTPVLVAGVGEMARGSSAEAVIHVADKDLLARNARTS